MFGDHKFHRGYYFAGIVVNDSKTVIAAKFQATTFVGNGELVVRIRHGSVNGAFEVFDNNIIETLKPVSFEEFFRVVPVSLTVYEAIGVAVVIVREFVEANVQMVVTVETHDGWREPILIDNGLQRLDLRVVDLVLGCQSQWQKEK